MKQLWIVVALMTGVAAAEDLPWQGTEIVVGADDAGKTYEISSPTNATTVRFDGDATIDGQTLTLDAPARVLGSGSLLAPLAGTNGLTVGWEQISSIFISDSDQVVWPNTQLSSVRSVVASLCGFWVLNPPHETIAVAFTNDGETATVQFQQKNNQHVKVFKVQFTQSGSDVVAKAVWARYSTDFSTLGKDWDKETISSIGSYSLPYSTGINQGGIGLTYISCSSSSAAPKKVALAGTFPSGPVTLNANEVTITPSNPITLTNAISGSVGTLVFKPRPSGDGEFARSGYIGTDEVLAFENAYISNVRFVSGHLYGTGLNTNISLSAGTASTASKYTADDTRIIQVQSYVYAKASDQYTKCVDVQFRQVGHNIYAKATNGRYCGGNNLGTYVDKNTFPVRTSDDESGYSYGLKNFVFDLAEQGCQVTLNCASTLDSMHRTVFDGLDVVFKKAGAFSSNGGTYDITNGASLLMDANVESQLGESAKTFNIYSNSLFKIVRGDWAIRPANVLNVCGGVVEILRPSYVGINTYLSNGGRIIAVDFSIAFGFQHDNDSIIATTGTEPCYIEGGVKGVKSNPGVANIFNLEADLHLERKGLLFYGDNFNGFNWRKLGSAKLFVEGPSTTTNPVLIEEGAVVLSDGAILNTNTLNLAGGALELGAASSNCVALVLSADSGIALGENSVLEVATIDSWDTTKLVTLSGSMAADGVFSGDLLLPDEYEETVIATLRYRDDRGKLRKVVRNGSGKLRAIIPGTVILLW